MNDERPIEKLLRRYAKKRRDEAGAPAELHPATRRMLQGEVSRRFPKSGADKKSSLAEFLAALSRRWAYAVAVLAVLLIASAVLLPGLSRTRTKALIAQKSPSFEPVKDERMTSELAKKATVEDGSATLAEKQLETPPVLAAAPPVPASTAPAQAARELNQPASVLSDTGVGRDERKPVGTLALDVDSDRKRVANEESLKFYAGPATNSVGQLFLAGKTTEPEAARTARADKLGTPPAAARPGTLASRANAAGEKLPADGLAVAASGKAGYDNVTAGGQFKESVTVASRAGAPARLDAPVKSEPLARGGGLEREKTRSVSQVYANIAPVARYENVAGAAPAAPVLANFMVEQAGSQVRVTDSDGSTYLGELQSAPVKSSSFAIKTKGAAELMQDKNGNLVKPPPATVPQETQNQFYRVQGTNRTLNQQVVFTWNFVDLTNALAASQAKQAQGALMKDAMKLQKPSPTLQNSGISGRAQLNADREFEIKAVPVTP